MTTPSRDKKVGRFAAGRQVIRSFSRPGLVKSALVFLGHLGHRDGESSTTECLNQRRMFRIERAGLVDERWVGFFGVGRP
jgi:hypothetical protein